MYFDVFCHRGIHENGFKSKLWTMRMFAGFGSPQETNSRFKYLLEQGQTGLSNQYFLIHFVQLQLQIHYYSLIF